MRGGFSVLRAPWVIAVALTIAAWVLIWPFGDFPLNDDFTFARVARLFAETGVLRVELPSAPSVVGQAVLVAPFVRVFGFSHTLLRLLTMLLGCVGLWALDRLFRRAGASARARTLLLCTLAFCPLYLYLATTFMTELWGHVPALLGVELWCWSREERPSRREWVGGALAAALIAGTFWIRQYCALAFPALAVAAIAGEVLSPPERRRRIAGFAPLALQAVILVAIVAAYFAWARRSGNYRPEFRGPLAEVRRIDVTALAICATSVSAYATVFLAPVLACFPWTRTRGRAAGIISPDRDVGDLASGVEAQDRHAGVPSSGPPGTNGPPGVAGAHTGRAAIAAGLVALMAAGVWLLRRTAPDDFSVSGTEHRLFPFGGNVMHNAGLGPVTLSDVYQLGLDHPAWPRWAWMIVTVAIVLGAALWTPVVLRVPAAIRSLRGNPRLELAAFAVAFGAASWLVPVQAFKTNAFDRYWLPCVLAFALLLSVLLGDEPTPDASSPRMPRRLLASAALLVPLAAFTVIALHDEFRWSEARWALVEEARGRGVSPKNLDGGYEVNGWIAADAVLAHESAIGCIGLCGCQSPWWCLDSSWRVSMNALHGYDVIRSLQPSYWLTNGPPVLLLRRQEQRVLVRYVDHGRHGAALDSPADATIEARWRILSASGPGLHPIRACSTTPPTISANRCDEGAVIGFLYDDPQPGTSPLYLCEVRGSDDRFVSPDAACEGQEPIGALGFTPG